MGNVCTGNRNPDKQEQSGEKTEEARRPLPLTMTLNYAVNSNGPMIMIIIWVIAKKTNQELISFTRPMRFLTINSVRGVCTEMHIALVVLFS